MFEPRLPSLPSHGEWTQKVCTWARVCVCDIGACFEILGTGFWRMTGRQVGVGSVEKDVELLEGK